MRKYPDQLYHEGQVEEVSGVDWKYGYDTQVSLENYTDIRRWLPESQPTSQFSVKQVTHQLLLNSQGNRSLSSKIKFAQITRLSQTRTFHKIWNGCNNQSYQKQQGYRSRRHPSRDAQWMHGLRVISTVRILSDPIARGQFPSSSTDKNTLNTSS